MWDIVELLERRQLDVGDLRERMYRAPTPREREGWHSLWLLAQGWTSSAVAEALERNPHTIGTWVTAFGNAGPTALGFEQSGGGGAPPPPALDGDQQAQLKAAVQALPEKAGIGLANWNWKVVRRFVQERFGLSPSRSSCLNYLHRLGFVLKRPKKRFLKGKPALVDSNSPRYGEKASYYSAVCLETGEVEWMELEGNSNSGTSVAFLTQLKEKHPGPLRVIWA